MFCTKCGKQLPENTIQCPGCGNINKMYNNKTEENTKKVYTQEQNEYRIVKNTTLTFTIIFISLIALILPLLFGGIRGNISIIALIIIILEIMQKKIYTVYFSVVFFINAILILDMIKWHGNVLDLVLLLLELIFSIWLFSSFIALVRGIQRKKMAITIALITIILDIATIATMDIRWINIMMIHICFLLILLSMDNKTNKEYTTLPNPQTIKSKGITAKNFPFCIIMSFMTFGLYYLYWRYCIVKDIKKVDGKSGSCLGEWILLIFIPVYDWFWLYTRANKLSVIALNNRIKATGSGVLYVILDIFFMGWINTLLMQNTLNALAAKMDENFIYGDTIQQNSVLPTYISNNIQNDDYINKLKNLNELKVNGIISEEEFKIKKEQLLSKI